LKRSEINALIRENIKWIEDKQVHLPPFAYWTPEEWAEKGHEYDEIRENMLGWDVTDYGRGDFRKTGLLLFTIRNGNLNGLWQRRLPKDRIAAVYHPERESETLGIWETICGKAFDFRGGSAFSKPLSLAQDGGHHKPWRRSACASAVERYNRRGIGSGKGCDGSH